MINGGKCEKTESFLKCYRGNGVSEPDLGISDAFNKGVKSSLGEYVVVLNSGDKLLNSTYYLKALEYLDSHPNISYIYGNTTFRHRNYGDIFFQAEPEKILQQMPFAHCSMIIRRSVFEQIGFFNLENKIAMDYDFLIRMHSKNLKGYYLNTKPVVLIDGTGISSLNGIAAIKETSEILKRNNMLTPKAQSHFKTLILKNKIRSFLKALGLLNLYDQIKKTRMKE